MERNPDKFQEIYDRYVNLVLYHAAAITKDYHIAQDICQEVFLKLHAYQDRLDEDRVKGWLIVVASNLALDYCRKNSSRLEVVSGDFDAFGERGSASVYRHDESERLCRTMLRELYLKNRRWYEAFMLVEYLGVPRKDAAAQMGVSLSSIDQYLRKSRKWMKSHFQSDYDELG